MKLERSKVETEDRIRNKDQLRPDLLNACGFASHNVYVTKQKDSEQYSSHAAQTPLILAAYLLDLFVQLLTLPSDVIVM
jgi:hypothetical protein